MPEQDVTLGEVYRAVLQLRDDVHQTRTDIHQSQKTLSEDIIKGALVTTEHGVKIMHLTERIGALESVKTRVESLETHPKSSADPLARYVAAIGTALAAALSWWFNRGG